MKTKISALFLLFLLITFSCQEQLDVKTGETPVTDPQLTDNSRTGPPVAAPLAVCGSSHSGFYATLNSYYIYPTQDTDVSCAAVGATITVNVSSQNVPNKFTVLDNTGATVAGPTSWFGTASYPGSWGMSLSAPGTGSLSFTKVAGKTYKIRVETQTPPNSSYSPYVDTWSASFSCTCAPCSPTCGGLFQGNYPTINSYYIYPAQTFSTACAAAGATITVSLTALDIPNRFTILDASNNPIVVSAWLGTASYPGLWGGSLAASSTGSISFTRVGTSYKIRVETQTPPNFSYNPTQDYWSASVSCP